MKWIIKADTELIIQLGGFPDFRIQNTSPFDVTFSIDMRSHREIKIKKKRGRRRVKK